MRHTLRITLGFLLVIIGLIGGLIPIFQGWVFGIPGLVILADYFPPVKRILDWAKSKYGNESDNKSSCIRVISGPYYEIRKFYEIPSF